MNEGAPKQGENEEEIDQSRRGFLKGAAALGVAAAGGVAYLANHSKKNEEESSEAELKPPYEGSIEQMSLENIMMEIVHDEARIVRLKNIETFGFSKNTEENYDVEYFLRPYRTRGEVPSSDEIEREIEVLSERVRQLRAYREILKVNRDEETPQ